LIIDLDLINDHVETDHCGSCTACIEACPTDAIVEPYVVDGSKCISYFTIELKDNIPSSMKGMFENWMFGCDTAVGENAETIEEVYEPFLIQQGFIMRTPRGREVMDIAYKHLGKVKANKQKGLF